jgi:hypothetical protein
MKNASQHAQTLKSLVKTLAGTYEAVQRPETDALRAVVLGALRENAPEPPVASAIEALDAEYVDLNEVRVATELELAELLEPAYAADAHERAERIKGALAAVFDVEGRLGLDRISELGKREQRPALRKIVDNGGGLFTPYIEAHVALVAYGIGTVPLDDTTRQYLVDQNVLDPDADLADAQRFIEQNLKVDDCWNFFAACRSEAFAAQRPRGKSAKKTVKKATKSTKKSPKKAAKSPKKTAKK